MTPDELRSALIAGLVLFLGVPAFVYLVGRLGRWWNARVQDD